MPLSLERSTESARAVTRVTASIGSPVRRRIAPTNAGIGAGEVREAHAPPSLEAAARGGAERDVGVPVAGEGGGSGTGAGRDGEERESEDGAESGHGQENAFEDAATLGGHLGGGSEPGIEQEP